MRLTSRLLAMVVCVAGGLMGSQAMAITSSFPTGLGISEPPTILHAYFSSLDYTVTNGIGHLHIDLGNSGFLQDEPSFTQLNPAHFNLDLDIDPTNTTFSNAVLDVGGDLGSGDKVYFYSQTLTGPGPTDNGFAFDPVGGTMEFRFVQEDKPTTDPAYAGIGSTVGVFVTFTDVGPTPVSVLDLNNNFSGAVDAKAWGSPVPEPVSTLLVGAGLCALAVRVSGRRRGV